MVFNFTLEYAIRRVQVIQDALKLNGTHQLLVYADDVNLYPMNAPSPFKAASYERTKKFKYPVHSSRGLEL